MKKLIKMIALGLCAALTMGVISGCGDVSDSKNDNSAAAPGANNSGESNEQEGVRIEGSFVITLYPEYAPVTCENFKTLVSEGFYDGVIFHRVVEDFMAQGGDPEGTGFGGSSTTITGEFASNGFVNNLSHKRGVVSMARAANDYNSASSQFFICYTDDCTFLDGDYAAFGEVTEGMEVVDRFLEIERVKGSDGALSSPVQPITIVKAEMIEDDENGNPRARFDILSE